MPDLTYVELFSGAGGLSMAFDRTDWQCLAHAEIEPHARAVLRRHWPTVPLLGDVIAWSSGRRLRKRVAAMLRGRVSVLAGGSPCQDLSVAGKRAGIEGARSSLFFHQVRWWRLVDSPYFVWENVFGALSSNKGRDFATVLSTLVGATVAVPAGGWQRGGVAAGPDAVAAWRVLDLQYFGPPQRRTRVFVLAARAGGVDPAQVLALTEGVCGHPAPRRGEEEAVAGTIMARTRGGGGIGTDFECAGGVVAIQEVGKRTVVSTTDVRAGIGIGTPGDPMYTLQAGAQHGVVVFHQTQDPISDSDVSPALGVTSGGMGVVCATGTVTHALTSEGADASEDGTGRGTPIVMASGQANAEIGHGVSPTLTLLHEAPIAFVNRPRRLTPRECERLMSWPDDHTRYGTDEAGREYKLSDTARYRLCGNGVGTVQAEWITRRLAEAIAAQERAV